MNIDDRTFAYFLYKGMNAIIFSDDFASVFDIVTTFIGIDDYTSLIALEEMIYNYRYILDDNMKDNISKLINFYRYDVEYESQEEKNEAFERLNNILCYINKSNTKELGKFVGLELKTRGVCFSSMVNYVLNSSINYEFSKIKKYNVVDFLVLCLLIDLFPKNDAQKIIEDFSSYNFPFIYSINEIISEWPKLILEERSLDKIKKVSELLKKDINDLDDKVIKEKSILQKEYKIYTKRVNKLFGKNILI